MRVDLRQAGYGPRMAEGERRGDERESDGGGIEDDPRSDTARGDPDVDDTPDLEPEGDHVDADELAAGKDPGEGDEADDDDESDDDSGSDESDDDSGSDESDDDSGSDESDDDSGSDESDDDGESHD